MLLGIILNMDYFMTVGYNFYFTNICQIKVIFFLANSYLYRLIPVFQRPLFVKFVLGDGCAMVLKSEVKYSCMSIAIFVTPC